MQLDTNNHSVFMLHYHLIMCIKYRNKVIDDIISNRLKEIFEKIAPAYNITLEEWKSRYRSCSYSIQRAAEYRNQQVYQCI